MATPKYPNIKIQLIGEDSNDGNAFSIIGRVCHVLRRGHVANSEIQEFVEEATSGNYENVLTTAARWVEVS